jgi:xanthine dehydrogenase accessory factor
MGAGDEQALAAAASSEATYIGLVASRKKARYLVDFVRAEGVSDDRLARVKFPAGLDLGGMSASEIALSILAEIVQRRHGKQAASPNVEPTGASLADRAPEGVAVTTPLGRGGPRPNRAPAMARDPICGMPVEIATARHTVVEGDHTVYFCCPGCRATYLKRQAGSTA